MRFCVFFFFQAEDGIRDSSVTGVQTCALPISSLQILCHAGREATALRIGWAYEQARSEERREGKSVDLGGRRIIKKKKKKKKRKKKKKNKKERQKIKNETK